MISALGPGYRLQWLNCILKGLEETGVPLICHSSTTGLVAGPDGDDVGIYYLIPKLAHLMGLSASDTSNLLTLILFWASALIGLLGFFVLFRNWISRFIAVGVVYYLYHLMAIKAEDGITYLLGPFLIVVMFPWLLYFVKIKKASVWISLSLLIFGVLLGVSWYVRTFSSIPLMVFAFSLILLSVHLSVKQKTLYLLIIVAGLGCVHYFFHSLIQQRDDYFLAKNPHYGQIAPYHPTWHAIYLGLGYLPNPEGIVWRDDCAFNKMHSIDPTVKAYSAKYEEILKEQTIQFVKKYPLLTVKILCAKALKLLSEASVFIGAIVIINLLQGVGWFVGRKKMSLMLTVKVDGASKFPVYCYCY